MSSRATDRSRGTPLLREFGSRTQLWFAMLLNATCVHFLSLSNTPVLCANVCETGCSSSHCSAASDSLEAWCFLSFFFFDGEATSRAVRVFLQWCELSPMCECAVCPFRNHDAEEGMAVHGIRVTNTLLLSVPAANSVTGDCSLLSCTTK